MKTQAEYKKERYDDINLIEIKARAEAFRALMLSGAKATMSEELRLSSLVSESPGLSNRLSMVKYKKMLY
ncbi:hypothetical protein vBYenSP400_23 [Yersinia phage vB_YenS_P400]|nr:hypothetical protein vBYenSP400_23 [Yersinia phage vB_YenS_P400]